MNLPCGETGPRWAAERDSWICWSYFVGGCPSGILIQVLGFYFIFLTQRFVSLVSQRNSKLFPFFDVFPPPSPHGAVWHPEPAGDGSAPPAPFFAPRGAGEQSGAASGWLSQEPRGTDAPSGHTRCPRRPPKRGGKQPRAPTFLPLRHPPPPNTLADPGAPAPPTPFLTRRAGDAARLPSSPGLRLHRKLPGGGKVTAAGPGHCEDRPVPGAAAPERGSAAPGAEAPSSAELVFCP